MTPYQAYTICLDENKRIPELESIILNNICYSFLYAKKIINGRWLEAEPIILRSQQYSYWYAVDIIKGRWLDAEPIIKKDKYFWNLYCYHLNIKKYKLNWRKGL